MTKKKDELITDWTAPIEYAHNRIKNGEYFTPENYVKYHKTFNLITANRSAGKSVSILCYMCEHFLDTGKKFVYIRTFDDNIKRTKGEIFRYINKLLFPYDSDKFFYIGTKNIIHYTDIIEGVDIECGQAIGLTMAESYKGGDFSGYDGIIYDEAISEQGNYDWIKTCLESLEFTIMRGRSEEFTVWIVGNNVKKPTIWLEHLQFDPALISYGQEGLWKNEHCLYVNYMAKEVSHKIKMSPLGFVSQNSDYGAMALDNNSKINERRRIFELPYKQEIKKCKYVLWRIDNSNLFQAYGIDLRRTRSILNKNDNLMYWGYIFRLSSNHTVMLKDQKYKEKLFIDNNFPKPIIIPFNSIDTDIDMKQDVIATLEGLKIYERGYLYDDIETYTRISEIFSAVA